MIRKKRLKLCLLLILLLMACLIGYRVYLLIYETDYEAVNATHIDRIEAGLPGKTTYNFAVVGNIRNSMRIFERRIAPLIKHSGADFVISLGNAVYDGTEAKYRLLYRGLRQLKLPYVLTAGPNEIKDFGAGKFYRHFGPYFFSFHLRNAFFIFLDSTGQTSWTWQLRWLREELASAGKYRYRFVFMSHSLFAVPAMDSSSLSYVLDQNLGGILQGLFSRYGVSAVFSAGFPAYHEIVRQGVRYIVSGGGGGLLLDGKQPYQFVKVAVKADNAVYMNVVAADRMGTIRQKLETLKLFLHSFFYMSFFNSLLILNIIGLVALKVYELILRQEHLYRDFNVDEGAFMSSPLRVAMFTNNYLPFIGGVPLSIDRLHRGLVRRGSTVKIFAPAYRQPWEDAEDGSVFRCRAPFYFKVVDFPVTNIFSRKINAAFKTFGGNLVHVHHPFWLGGKGMRLARKSGVPVVFTYHTRLEHYTHYIPVPGTALKNLVGHFLIKRFANRCDAIITPTASTEEYLRNLGVSALIETIPTGIDVDDYRRWSDRRIQSLRSRYTAPGESLLISVSRMAKEKNIDFLLAGLTKVKERASTRFKCLLVGDGPEKERLEKKASALGMEEEVIFTGNIDPGEVAGCYLAADLFVFASTSETQGMVLLEAMAGGCPVVAVRASGVYDIVTDGYNGLTVAESTDSWAEAVAGLLNDPEKLSALATNSRAFAERYSIARITEKIVRLYWRVVILGKSKNE